MSVSERLKQYCKVNGITQDSLVSKGFGTKQTINNYINGNTEAKSGFLEKFIKEFRLSAKWLMIGEEEVLVDVESKKEMYKENDSLLMAEDKICHKCELLQAKLDGALDVIKAQKETIDILRGETKKENISYRSAQGE